MVKMNIDSGNIAQNDYNHHYEYYSEKPHTIMNISDGQYFDWDKNGNMTLHRKSKIFDTRCLCWDEESRLRGVADDKYASIYGYDAGGERAIKFTGTNEWLDVNGIPQGFAYLNNMTLYTSPYLVASQKGYTKHYYIENQRIASKLGNGGLQDLDNANQAMTVEEKEKRSAKIRAFKTGLSNAAQCLNLKNFDFVFKTNCPPPPNAAKFEPCLFQYMDVLEETEPDRYYYHPDHLGSASWITDAGGKPIQHLAYLPFGEEFVDQRTSDWSAAYKFTGKEKDEETGYNYFGARYYMSDIGIWASPDPLSDKYPSTSSYAYCRNNPVILIDPNGMNDTDFGVKKNGEVIQLSESDDKPDRLFAINDDKSIKKNDEGKDIMIELKGKIDGRSVQEYPWREDSKFDTELRFGDNFDDAKEAFRFMDKNTTVEWQLYGHYGNKGIQHDLRTSHLEETSYADIPARIADGGNLIYHYHNHNHSRKHSCFPSSQITNGRPADKEFRDNALIKSSSAKFGIFYEGRLYDYNCTRMGWDCWK